MKRFHCMPNLQCLRRPTVLGRRLLRQTPILQIALIGAFWLLGTVLTAWMKLPLPGSILGLALLLVLMKGGWFSPQTIRRGARWFLTEMLLFFVPAVPVIVEHHEFFGWLGLKVAFAVTSGTVIVMIVTALTVELCCRGRNHHVFH